MNTVSTKSAARIESDDPTTVRVVALETPSAVGANLIGLLPLRRVARLAGAALVEEGLDVGLAKRQPRRATIDDSAERRAMAFPPSGEAKNASEAVETHRLSHPAECRCIVCPSA